MSLPVSALLLLSSHFPASVSAFPYPNPPSNLRPRHQILSRDDTASNSNSSVKVWVPILAIMIILISIAVFYWTRGKGLRFFGPTSAVAGTTPLTQQTTGVREITAEQLAGTINDGVSNTTAANGRTRRTRRPRRTPSQISTTSLPAYNKEPGDEELVIFRGPQDMEDVTMPAATVMPPVDEDGETSIHTGDHSQASRYTPMPDSPHNMPLLGDDNSRDSSPTTHSPSDGNIPTRSNDLQNNNSHETSALSQGESHLSGQEGSDPRGEAPPYFEVVDHNSENNQATVTRRSVTANANASATPAETTAILNATTPPATPERPPERRSGFRNLLNRMSVNSHARGDSEHSVLTTNTSREGSASRASHRPSLSSSSHHLTSSMFRTLSRQKSNATLASNRLNSPSLISLNSISSPLTHTTMRTEFTYPKAGPTPEQLKLISSRESFAKFGVPYGADAIAFAASASRQELPPPDFDAASSDVHLPRSAGAGPSRLRSSSRAADLVNSDNDDADSSRSSSLDEARDDERRLSSPIPDRAAGQSLAQADVTTSTDTSRSNESTDITSPILEDDEKESEHIQATSKDSSAAVAIPPTPVSAVPKDLSKKASLKISTAKSSLAESTESKTVVAERVAEDRDEQSHAMLPTPVSIDDSSKRSSVATIVPGTYNRASVLPQSSQIREEDDSTSIPPGLSSETSEPMPEPPQHPTLASQHSTENLKSTPPIRKPSAPPSSFQPPPSSYNAASLYSRSESRASSFSVQTFETAAETVEYSTPLASATQMDGDSDISEPGTPTATTPRLGEATLPENETPVAVHKITA